MKKITRTVEISEWNHKCPHCDKMVSGKSKEQTEWNLSIHILSKHKNLINDKKRGKKNDKRPNLSKE